MKWLGVGTGTVSSAIDTGLGMLNSYFNAEMDHKYWQKRYDITRQDYLADRQHQEEYNSPANQMKLLAKAGLNPNLIYGQKGGVGASGTFNAQQQSAPFGGRSSNTTSVAMNAAALAQSDQLMAQSNRTKAETRLINMQADWYGTMQGKQVDFLNSQIDRINQEVKESEARIEAIAQDIKVGKSTVSKQDSETMLNFYRTFLTETETQLKQKQISTEEALQAQMAAQTALYSQQVWTEIAKRDQMSAQTWLTYAQEEYQQLMNEITSSNLDFTIESNKEELLYKIADFGKRKGIVGNQAYQWAAAIAPLVNQYAESARDLNSIGVDWYKAVNRKNGGFKISAGDIIKIANKMK